MLQLIDFLWRNILRRHPGGHTFHCLADIIKLDDIFQIYARDHGPHIGRIDHKAIGGKVPNGLSHRYFTGIKFVGDFG